MVKKMIVLLAVSILLMFTMPYAQLGLQVLVDTHDWIAQILTDVFSGGQAGNIARNLLALLSVPIVVGFIPGVIYWGIKRHWFPYFMDIVWIVWLIQAGALIIMYKA